MSGNESRSASIGPKKGVDTRSPAANSPLDAVPGEFDPRESFWPRNLPGSDSPGTTVPRADGRAAPGPAPAQSSSSKAGMLAVVVVIAVAAIGYLLYTQRPADGPSTRPESASAPANKASGPVSGVTAPTAVEPSPPVTPAPSAASSKAASAAVQPPAEPVATASTAARKPRGVEPAASAAPDAAGRITHTKGGGGVPAAPAPTTSTYVPPPRPPAAQRSLGNCTEALAALGLCTPVK